MLTFYFLGIWSITIKKEKDLPVGEHGNAVGITAGDEPELGVVGNATGGSIFQLTICVERDDGVGTTGQHPPDSADKPLENSLLIAVGNGGTPLEINIVYTSKTLKSIFFRLIFIKKQKTLNH